jgi:3-methyladenine DNA glycosylase/8-oxoguanine DNA glycosylase
MEIKKIGFGDEGQVATAELLARLPGFQARALAAAASLSPHLDRTRRGLETLQALERQHGGSGPIAIEGVEELVSAILSDLAHVEAAGGGVPY